LKLNF
jgi:SNF related kinase